MSSVAQSYIINYLRDGTAAAIVSFSFTAKVLASITEITDSSVRENLAAKIPTEAGGGTGIGYGLLLCQEVKTNLLQFFLIFLTLRKVALSNQATKKSS